MFYLICFLLPRMEVDDVLFAKYRRNKDTKTGFEGDCDADCKARTMCDLRTTSYTQEQQCRDGLK